ncbi:hypothetical protein LINGRAHAP2_LOCUS25746 [Linum grandiflorum]
MSSYGGPAWNLMMHVSSLLPSLSIVYVGALVLSIRSG